jgi:DnaJ-class molecular chaperone
MNHQRKGVQTLQVNVSLETVLNGSVKKFDHSYKVLCSDCKGNGVADLTDIIKCVKCNGTGSTSQVIGGFMMINTTCNSCFGAGQMVKPGKECKTCSGEKLIKVTKTLKLDIPKGITNGSVMKVENKGDYNLDCKQHNDLQIVFVYDIPNDVIIDNNNVQIRINITIEELFCGFKKTLSPYGDGSNNVISICSTGYFNPTKQHMVKDKGLPIFNTTKRGDLYLIFNIIYPEDSTKVNKYHDIYLKVFKVIDIIPSEEDIMIF